MKTKSVKVLPKTTSEIQNGGMYLQRVRCGKQNCKCASGELHSAFYFFTRQHGKLTKFYIRKSELKQFKMLVNQAAERRKAVQQTTKSNHLLLRQFRQTLRERNLFINSLKEM
jgi:hypothetical protein